MFDCIHFHYSTMLTCSFYNTIYYNIWQVHNVLCDFPCIAADLMEQKWLCVYRTENKAIEAVSQDAFFHTEMLFSHLLWYLLHVPKCSWRKTWLSWVEKSIMLTFSYHLTRPGQVQDVVRDSGIVICLHDTWTLYEHSVLHNDDEPKRFLSYICALLCCPSRVFFIAN